MLLRLRVSAANLGQRSGSVVVRGSLMRQSRSGLAKDGLRTLTETAPALSLTDCIPISCICGPRSKLREPYSKTEVPTNKKIPCLVN